MKTYTEGLAVAELVLLSINIVIELAHLLRRRNRRKE